MDMPENIGIGHIAVNIKRLMGEYPESIENNGQIIHLRKAQPAVMVVRHCVMVAFYHELCAMQLSQAGFIAKIAKEIHYVVGVYGFIPVCDESLVHLGYILERPVFISADIFISKMCIRDEISIWPICDAICLQHWIWGHDLLLICGAFLS